MRRLLAVLGRDVSRSLSPQLHGAAAEALGLDVAYVPVSCASEAHFDEAVLALQVLGARGANVTIPYKDRALALASELSDAARAMAAVNTFTFEGGGRILGDNTDGPGLAAVLAALPAGTLARVQILGAGGAARAAAWALREVAAGEVRVSARRGGDACAAIAGGTSGPLTPVPGATLVISSLPNDPGLATEALASWIDVGARPYVLDLAYGGATPSPLVQLAAGRGLAAQDGLAMLVEQAARALASWTGGEVSRILAVMREAAARTRPLQ